jgi:purine nucleosidase
MREIRKVILDCDPGIDDALALMLAAGSPEINLLAVTCVAGNRPVDITSSNARRILDLAGRPSVPVHAGAARPLAHALPRCNDVHGEDGLGGVALGPARDVDSGFAADIIIELLEREPPETITLIGIGPLTNYALAEIRRPGILRRARAVLLMGGAAFCPGNITPAAEFNFYADALAAHVVANAHVMPVVFGLDVTTKAVMSPEWIASVGELRSKCGMALERMLAAYARLDPLLHDVCPVAYLLESDLFRKIRCSLAIDWRNADEEGKSLVQRADGKDGAGICNATIVTDVATERLLNLVLSRLATLP